MTGPSDRRMAILEHLCQVRHDSVANLAAMFGVCKRTIRYDITALSCSYPITTVRGANGGGVFVAKWFYLNRKTLSGPQLELLFRLRKSLSGNDLTTMDSILSQFAPYSCRP